MTDLFKKVGEIRAEIVDTLKKSGANKGEKFGFKYFELGDFFPQILKLEKDKGLFSIFEIQPEHNKAMLTVYNTHKEGEVFCITTTLIMFTSNRSAEIQNLGATHTYLKRYLYMDLYNIAEPDQIDAQDNSKDRNNHYQNGQPYNQPYTQNHQPSKEKISNEALDQKWQDIKILLGDFTPEDQKNIILDAKKSLNIKNIDLSNIMLIYNKINEDLESFNTIEESPEEESIDELMETIEEFEQIGEENNKAPEIHKMSPNIKTQETEETLLGFEDKGYTEFTE